MGILSAVLGSWLPRKYRKALIAGDVPPVAAILGGIIESTASVALLVRGYFAFMNQRLQAMPTTAMVKLEEQGGDTAVKGLGMVFSFEYFLHLTTMVLVFFAVEGFVRALAAAISGEIVPSLPLYALSAIEDGYKTRAQDRRLGKRVRDAVMLSEDGESLRIASCRPKQWTRSTTIAHAGVFYEIATEEEGAAPHTFVYVLRRKPLNGVIRGVHQYDPEEVLRPVKA
jgi:hypothetical protein